MHAGGWSKVSTNGMSFFTRQWTGSATHWPNNRFTHNFADNFAA